MKWINTQPPSKTEPESSATSPTRIADSQYQYINNALGATTQQNVLEVEFAEEKDLPYLDDPLKSDPRSTDGPSSLNAEKNVQNDSVIRSSGGQ